MRPAARFEVLGEAVEGDQAQQRGQQQAAAGQGGRIQNSSRGKIRKIRSMMRWLPLRAGCRVTVSSLLTQ